MDEDHAPMGASGTISALLADVDGTLVTKEKILTKRAIEAVRKLHENSISIRMPRGRLKMPIAAFNGGMIVQRARPLPPVAVSSWLSVEGIRHGSCFVLLPPGRRRRRRSHED